MKRDEIIKKCLIFFENDNLYWAFNTRTKVLHFYYPYSKVDLISFYQMIEYEFNNTQIMTELTGTADDHIISLITEHLTFNFV